MVFKQVQWCYFMSLMLFFLVFFVSKEIVNYTTQKEKNNRFFRLICFSREPVPLVTVVLIMIDYVCLVAMFVFNIASLFLSNDFALILVLVCNGVFLAFAGIAGQIAHCIKKHWEDVG